MKMYDVPHYNRPNVRLKRHGTKVLSDAELLAIILGRGNSQENAVDMSNRVLNTMNFPKLASLSLAELKDYFKDDVKAMKILAMFEIFRRTNQLDKQGFKEKIKNARDVFNRYVDQLKDEKQEHFLALYLDTKNQLLEDRLVSKGTLNASLIHPREVFNQAIKASANSIILVHNHPSGDPTPSKEDEVVTKNLVNAGDLLGIHVLDHVIIGQQEYISLREKGII
jgi:DNA repair protein RadC